jgi:hypothetical protein
MSLIPEIFKFLPLYTEDLKMTTPNALDLSWDNSHLGIIDEYVIAYKKSHDEDCIYIWERMKKKSVLKQIRIMKFRDSIPLITDESKSLFQIRQIGMHRATFRDQECVITRFQNDVPYDVFESSTDIKTLYPGFRVEIQRLYVFRYLMCLNCNNDSKIEIRYDTAGLPFPVSCRETTFSMDPDVSVCRLPNTVMEKWFNNDMGRVFELAKEMIGDRDSISIKFKLQDIIRKYDNGKFIGWVNAIFEKVKMCKNM